MKPFVSIIIPIYNAEQTLDRSIQSVLNQSFDRWELILVNDGSGDRSAEICQGYSADPRISYLEQSNQGVSAARNLGAEQAQGKYLVFLDSDDSISENHLSDFFQNDLQEPDLMTCGMHLWVKKAGGWIKRPNQSQQTSIIPGSWMIKTEIFKELGGFDEQLKFAENTEFFFRFDQQERTRKDLPHANLNYYQSAEGGSKNLQNMIDSILIILAKHQGKLSSHVVYLYYQIVGVNLMRLNNYGQARIHLWKALRIKPFQLKTIARLGLSFLPLLAKKVYTQKIPVK